MSGHADRALEGLVQYFTQRGVTDKRESTTVRQKTHKLLQQSEAVMKTYV